VRPLRWAPLAVALGGCAHRPVRASIPQAQGSRPNAALESGQATLDDGWHLDPREVLAIADASPLEYRVQVKGRAGATRFHALPTKDAPRAPQNHVVRRGHDGRPQLRPVLPPPASLDQLQSAALALEAGDQAAARSHLALVTVQAPDWAAGWALAGQVAWEAGDDEAAATLLQRSVEQNPIDARTWWTLGRVHAEAGRTGPAHDALVRAYVLDPNHAQGLADLEATLELEGKRLAALRLDLPFTVAMRGDVVQVSMRDPVWMPMAMCVAVWSAEPALQAQVAAPELREATAWRSCFASAAMGFEALAAARQPLPPRARRLMAAAQGGFLELLVLWDILGHEAPDGIALLPDHLRAASVEYVERYVIETE
jgi:tetratricopeptide (TPR) repeat protein